MSIVDTTFCLTANIPLTILDTALLGIGKLPPLVGLLPLPSHPHEQDALYTPSNRFLQRVVVEGRDTAP